MSLPDPYERLGVRRRINAAGALTRLGRAVMAPEVVAAGPPGGGPLAIIGKVS